MKKGLLLLALLALAPLLCATPTSVSIDGVTVPSVPASQYGAWGVSILNQPSQYSVTQGGLFNVGQYGTWYVGQYGPWSVSLDSSQQLGGIVNPVTIQATQPYIPVAEGSWVYVTACAVSATFSVQAYNLTFIAGVNVPLEIMVRESYTPAGSQGFDYEIAGAIVPWTLASLQANWAPPAQISQIPLQAAPGQIFYTFASGTAGCTGSIALYQRLTYTAQ
jgi:hypothetical protein